MLFSAMDRLLYQSLSSTGRNLVISRVQSDLKQKSIEEKIQLFPLGITPTASQIKYAVIPISPGYNSTSSDPFQNSYFSCNN